MIIEYVTALGTNWKIISKEKKSQQKVGCGLYVCNSIGGGERKWIIVTFVFQICPLAQPSQSKNWHEKGGKWKLGKSYFNYLRRPQEPIRVIHHGPFNIVSKNMSLECWRLWATEHAFGPLGFGHAMKTSPWHRNILKKHTGLTGSADTLIHTMGTWQSAQHWSSSQGSVATEKIWWQMDN